MTDHDLAEFDLKLAPAPVVKVHCPICLREEGKLHFPDCPYARTAQGR